MQRAMRARLLADVQMKRAAWNYTRLALKICSLAFVGFLIVISVFPRSRNLVCGLDTEEEIFEVYKEYLLDPKNNTLRKNHLDASVFDNIIHGEVNTVCKTPKSHWFIRQDLKDFSPQSDYWPVDIAIVTIVKGECTECWDRVLVGAQISRCGNVYQDAVSRMPNRNGEVQNGKFYYTGYCGPVSNDQADVSR
jgi:hypothetical protein